MSFIILVSGILLVTVTALDFFYTTLSFNGAGPINKAATATLSSFFLFLADVFSNRRILKFSGLSHILMSISLWVLLLWIGLFLILSSAESAVVHSSSRAPANLVNIFYFSGYVLSTLGNGEFIPASENWQLTVAFFSFSGLIFITTGISYLLNLASAILHKRTLALSISNLGASPEEIVTHTYGNGNFQILIDRLPDLQNKINKHNQHHFAYPISHYFYSISHEESLALNLSRLDEALTIIYYHTEKSVMVEKEISIIRQAIHSFLEVLQHSFFSELEDHEDITPDLEELKKQGVHLIGQLPERKKPALKKRRSLLAGFMRSSGWSWQDVYSQNQ